MRFATAAVLMVVMAGNASAQSKWIGGYGNVPIYTTANLPACTSEWVDSFVFDSTAQRLMRCDGDSWELGVPYSGTGACSAGQYVKALNLDAAPTCDTPASGGSPTWGSITGTLSNQTDLQSALDGKEASGSFSGVGACSSNQWASTLNDGAAPTCSQPAFSNLSGSATDAQVPNNITVDLATVASTANAGDSATSFFTSGAIEVARGGNGAAPGADDQVMVSDSTSAGTFRAVPNCTDTGGNHLNYTASSNTFSCGTSSSGGGGGPQIVRKSADQGSTSTSFADVTGMTFSLSASTSYSIVCEGSYTTAVSTTAIQLSLNGPAGATAIRYTVQVGTTATAIHNSSQSAYDTVVNPATGGGATALPWKIAGTIENGGTAGTLALRLRTEVSASAATVQRGAFCVLY